MAYNPRQHQTQITLVVLSALAIPLLLLAQNTIITGLFISALAALQALQLYLFYESKAKGPEWLFFWTAISALVYALLIPVFGKNTFTEFLGLVLFFAYFIITMLALFYPALRKTRKKTRKDIKDFRKKDELKELADFFEPGKQKAEYKDIQEPDFEKIIIEPRTQEPEKKQEEKTPPKQTEDYFQEYEQWLKEKPGRPKPKKTMHEPEDRPKPEKDREPYIKEIREAPEPKTEKRPGKEMESIKSDMQSLSQGVKTIREKVQEIADKAVQDKKKYTIGEREKKTAQKSTAKKAKAKTAKKTEKNSRQKKVYASKTGKKYHYDQECSGLKRVSEKNIIRYDSAQKASHKGLSACELCKK